MKKHSLQKKKKLTKNILLKLRISSMWSTLDTYYIYNVYYKGSNKKIIPIGQNGVQLKADPFSLIWSKGRARGLSYHLE